MRHPFDLIIWDWDGTLADSTSMITDAMVQASLDVGMGNLDRTRASHIIGLSLNAAIHSLFGDIDDDTMHALASRYRQHYYANESKIPMFEGADTLINTLHTQGILLAVATGKGRRGLNLALDRSGLREFFHTTRTVDECFSKPHPQMIEEIMDELGATAERTLMIGDTGFDLQMAANANVASVGVSYGAQPREKLELFDPIAIFDQFSALHQWILHGVK